MFKIGDYSRLTQVTIKALRHYDSLGLLKPAAVDPETGYRYYSAAQLPRLNRILALKDLGLSLEQIGPFLDTDLSVEQMRALLLIKQTESRQRMEEERDRLARIDARLHQLEGRAVPAFDVVVKAIDSQRVASLRGTVPNRAAIGDLFRQLATYQRRHALTATAWAAIWHDPDFREADVDAEATFATDEPLPPSGTIRSRELPAVATMACVVHQGPPRTIGQACMALLTWVEANGYQVAGPERVRAVERGHEGQDSISELQLPVARANADTDESGLAQRSDAAATAGV